MKTSGEGHLRPLTADDFETLYAAFREAFSDYVVPFAPTREQLLEMLTRRGWKPELSVGAFDGERMVGFTANGFDGVTAYDSGTGVVPSHRRRGLSRAMFDWLIPRLRAAGASRYLLEVIETNKPAEELYRGLGFRETRRFDCWVYESRGDAPRFGGGAINPEWWDVEPPWQNSNASLARARDRHVVIGDERGYAAVFPNSGDLAQLAVAREHRRRGVGRQLLDAAAAIANKPLRVLNVDDRDEGIAAFFEAVGARRIVRQIEMVLAL
ncbi:MAG TPA: GNAT family N-acetyltransferase [Thermoanaerobaculia bacterium]|nr:GNAT family N-acetyltransferase [Thermoanaerobaculia bacterium]